MHFTLIREQQVLRFQSYKQVRQIRFAGPIQLQIETLKIGAWLLAILRNMVVRSHQMESLRNYRLICRQKFHEIVTRTLMRGK